MWAREKFPQENFQPGIEGFRLAYQMRLRTAPGVVTTSDEEIGASLGYSNEEVELPDGDETRRLRELWSRVEEDYVTPSGDEIQHEMHVHKWLHELSAGFYNDLVWPSPEDLVRRGHEPGVQEASTALDKALEHHEMHQVYSRMLRRWLRKHSRPGLDTPALVGTSLYHHGAKEVGDSELHEVWRETRALAWEGMPERDSIAVRVCDYKVRHAARWASQLEGGGVIWYYHKEIGRWLHEQIRDAIWCPSESDRPGVNAMLARMTEEPEKHAGDLLICSLAHREGKNLQFLSRALVVQWPRDAKAAEQMAGRLHRNGQVADHVSIDTCHSNSHDHLSFAACINDAVYIQQTIGQRQKLVFGDHNPLPKVFHPALLRERGLQPRDLSREQREMLTERFGDWTS